MSLKSIRNLRVLAVAVAALAIVAFAFALIDREESPPAGSSSSLPVTAARSSPTPAPTSNPAFGDAVPLPSGLSAFASPQSDYGQIPVLYRLYSDGKGTVTRELLFDGRDLRAGPATGGFSVGFDESKRSIAVAACTTLECGYGGGGDRGESVVVLSSDDGATWTEVGRAAGDVYIAGVIDGEVLIGDHLGSASTLGSRGWRWLPSGRAQPTPVLDRQGANARVIPGLGVVWNYPTSPYYASDGTTVSAAGSIPIGKLNGVMYYWRGICSTTRQTDCVRTSAPAVLGWIGDDKSRADIVFPWYGPAKLRVMDVVAPTFCFGLLLDAGHGEVPVMVDLAAGKVHPLEPLSFDGHPLVSFAIRPEP